ncbi:hypothetical protein ACQP2C_32360 [Micromonospora zamorensis]|uniref:hypothetical protein n=1 Tax=Micromonospora zamorensis TaxID=709883 RepID=UPI003D9987B0
MRPPAAFRRIRAAARTFCAVILTIRIADVIKVADLPEYVWLCMLPFFIGGIGVAAWSSYRIRVFQAEVAKEVAESRAQVAELEAARLRRQDRRQAEAEDEEWARWWAEAHDDQQDTIAFGQSVVLMQPRRAAQQPKAAG